MAAIPEPAKHIVVLDTNAFWTEQLFHQCAAFAKILLLKPRDFRAHKASSGSWVSDRAPRRLGPNLWEQRLSMLPGWMFGLWPLAQRKLVRAIRAWADSQRACPTALVLTYPQYRSLIPKLKPALSVYYNLDDYRDNWPGRGERISDWEAEIVELADLTICIADHRARLLLEQHSTRANRIHHLPLGCTPEFMSDSGHRPPPSVLADLPHPLAGYIGALNYRFDFAFLAAVAAQLPAVTFALGGRVLEDGDVAWRAGLALARTLRNIKLLGWVEHAKLPEHLAAFDVLLMPYAPCNFNTNACPAKLWDYLGTGKPIVTNNANPETLLWSEVVHVGATPAEFADRLRLALAGEAPHLRERRLQIARDHTWDKLSQRMETLLSFDLSASANGDGS